MIRYVLSIVLFSLAFYFILNPVSCSANTVNYKANYWMKTVRAEGSSLIVKRYFVGLVRFEGVDFTEAQASEIEKRLFPLDSIDNIVVLTNGVIEFESPVNHTEAVAKAVGEVCYPQATLQLIEFSKEGIGRTDFDGGPIKTRWQRLNR